MAPSPSLPPVEVLPFHLDSDRDIDLAEAEGVLDEIERERAAAFKFPAHRDRFVRGRGMVRKALAVRLGQDPRSLRFVLGGRGKPSLAEAGASWHFNLSHSEDLAALAMAAFPDLGIDLERCDRSVDVSGLSRRCFLPREIERIEARSGAERIQAFFWTWTAKEARMKATGEGFALSPQRIEVAFEGELPTRYLAPAVPAAHLAPIRLHDGGAVCAVAALRPFALVLAERR